MTEAREVRDGQTATSKDGQRRVVWRNGMWLNDTSYRPAAKRDKPTTQDRTALNTASAKAATERDAMRTYDAAAKAVDDMGTGPGKAKMLDIISPDEGSGAGGWSGLADQIGDSIGVALGTPFRPLVSQRTLDARDQLRTVSANVALAGSQMMKGSSSDKDTALMRMSGLSPYKGVKENKRIIAEARYKSGLEQTRAMVTSSWLAKRGSLSTAAANGLTFERALGIAERDYAERMAGGKRGLPTAPPGVRRGRVVTIDLDGNPIQ